MKTSPTSTPLRGWVATVLVAIAFATSGAAAPPQYSVLDLGALLPDVSVATGINDAGMVTGYTRFAGDAQVHAFLYSHGVMHDLGTIGQSSSFGGALNNLGEVVGNYE